jgi:hypothetical protein
VSPKIRNDKSIPQPTPRKNMLRGEPIYYNTGELSFETSPQTAGTFKGVFLEWIGDKHVKILTKDDKIKIIDKNLISKFNI